MYEFIFVVKASKFCNLRCAYCYEHRELHVRDTMRIETLEHLFAGIDGFGGYLRGLGMISPTFSFVWHGGEPLLLPPDYYERIAGLQRELIRGFPYRNSVQTNLFGGNGASLRFALDAGWEIGVSIDFASGIRINAGERDSNDSVIAAAEALHNKGASFGAISVLGAHNRDSLADAYDWVAENAAGWRILPVFEGGPEDDISRLRIPECDVVRVFLALFHRRANAKKHIPIAPLDDYIRFAALKISGRRTNDIPDRNLLDNIFVLNVNGDVFTRPFAYDAEFRLGNINRNSMCEMVESRSYKSCQRAITHLRVRNCIDCAFRGFCDASPVQEHGSLTGDAHRRRCVFPRSAMQEIEHELREVGVDRSVIGQWSREAADKLLPQPLRYGQD